MLEALGEASPFVAMWRRVSFCIAAMREHLVSECWLPPSIHHSRAVLSVKSLNWSVCAFTAAAHRSLGQCSRRDPVMDALASSNRSASTRPVGPVARPAGNPGFGLRAQPSAWNTCS